MPLAALKGLSKSQRHVVAASYLGWMLDAFDFFLLVFVMTDVAKEFDVPEMRTILRRGMVWAARD